MKEKENRKVDAINEGIDTIAEDQLVQSDPACDFGKKLHDSIQNSMKMDGKLCENVSDNAEKENEMSNLLLMLLMS